MAGQTVTGTAIAVTAAPSRNGAGDTLGARLQSLLPDLLIRRLLGVLEIAIAIRFLIAGLV
ncbi:MAG TPA: hypothetical protein VME44_28385 [Streptosporangiaceae bacterium]|nr:hypothetical protein [Streptosporangiaceae bacterium]